MDYFNRVITDFERELPFPSLSAQRPPATTVVREFERIGTSTIRTFCDDIRQKAVYFAVPYEASTHCLSHEMPGRLLAQHPDDPAELLSLLVDAKKSAIVIGEPGSGKTVLAMITFAALADNYIREGGASVLPIFIRMSTLDNKMHHSDDQQSDLLGLLSHVVPSRDTSTFTDLLDKSAIAVIVDGLDESPSTLAARDSAIQLPPELNVFTRHTAIATCRAAFYSLVVDANQISRELGCVIRLSPLDYTAHAVPFVYGYCTANKRPDIAPVMLEILSSKSRVALVRETLSRPLMLRMTVDVLFSELAIQKDSTAARMLLTDSYYMTAEIYERYIRTWIKREQQKIGPAALLGPLEKIDLVQEISWHVFRTSITPDTGYGAFEITDLTIDRASLVSAISSWIANHPKPADKGWNESDVRGEIEERSFLIINSRGDTYRFAHKSFFEYLLGRFVFSSLDSSGAELRGVHLNRRILPEKVIASLQELLGTPFPDEVIGFLRGLLHWSVVRDDMPRARRNVEVSLLRVVDSGDHPEGLMARQQAANLLPIVATKQTREHLRSQIGPAQHPFIRRAIAVGEALHHNDAALLNEFVVEMNSNPVARSYHMGYNRMYYGDQPLGLTDFVDDGGVNCELFFRACVRHVKLARYRYLRAMDFASVRFMLEASERRDWLSLRERQGMDELRTACDNEDPELGEVYEQERKRLASLIDELLAIQPGVQQVAGDDCPLSH